MIPLACSDGGHCGVEGTNFSVIGVKRNSGQIKGTNQQTHFICCFSNRKMIKAQLRASVVSAIDEYEGNSGMYQENVGAKKIHDHFEGMEKLYAILIYICS